MVCSSRATGWQAKTKACSHGQAKFLLRREGVVPIGRLKYSHYTSLCEVLVQPFNLLQPFSQMTSLCPPAEHSWSWDTTKPLKPLAMPSLPPCLAAWGLFARLVSKARFCGRLKKSKRSKKRLDPCWQVFPCDFILSEWFWHTSSCDANLSSVFFQHWKGFTEWFGHLMFFHLTLHWMSFLQPPEQALIHCFGCFEVRTVPTGWQLQVMCGGCHLIGSRAPIRNDPGIFSAIDQQDWNLFSHHFAKCFIKAQISLKSLCLWIDQTTPVLSYMGLKKRISSKIKETSVAIPIVSWVSIWEPILPVE